MKHSIRIKFTLAFVGMIAASIGVCLFINAFFLEDFYLSRKQRVLMEAYENMNSFLRVGGEEEKMKSLLQKLWDTSGISVLILDAKNKTLYYSTLDPAGMRDRLQYYLFSGKENPSVVPWEQKQIYWDKDYKIILAEDQAAKNAYMESWGFFDDGSLFLMSLPVESIRKSVSISNTFYFLVGGIVVVFSGVFMLYMTRRLTRPILTLSAISEQMAGLNFQVRYQSDTQDEVDILGNSINHLADTLETTIGELQAANEQLKKDIEEKVQIDDMRKEFLSNVSHELKTPIAIIQGYAEGLKDCIHDDSESREYYCDVIMDEAYKMNQMVQKLLNLNQLEFGNTQVEPEVFDIIALIRGVVQASEILIRQKDGTIFLPEGEPVYVLADEFMVEEVVKNYLSNAIHHLEGKKQIRVILQQTEEQVRVSVFNTGEPVPEEALEKVWIKFYKVDKARTREYGGSGIGLSIVKAIMEAHHQTCGVENREGGVEFWFTLPVAQKPYVPEKIEET